MRLWHRCRPKIAFNLTLTLTFLTNEQRELNYFTRESIRIHYDSKPKSAFRVFTSITNLSQKDFQQYLKLAVETILFLKNNKTTKPIRVKPRINPEQSPDKSAEEKSNESFWPTNNLEFNYHQLLIAGRWDYAR